MNSRKEAICPYCGVGCRLAVVVEHNRVLSVRGVADAPANQGGICAKGATLSDTVDTPDRLTVPLVRHSRSDALAPTTWESAVHQLARRFQDLQSRYGPDSVAFYGSGQLDTEAAYCAVKLFKGHLRTNNTDSNSRLCMAAPVAGYRTSLGSDGPPTCYEDIDLADCILIIGSNMAETHPVTFDRVKAARKRRSSVQIIVADPRRTPTAEWADLHIPLAPGSDIALLNALGRLLLDTGRIDHEFIAAHTAGFAEYREFLQDLDVSDLATACGVPVSLLRETAGRIRRADRFLSFYCMGLGQSTVGMRKVNSLINLHLLTGTIGQPGCGPFSLTGQPNSMGGREVGILSHQLPGYRFVDHPRHRTEVERYWGLPAGHIRSEPGLTAVEMFRALERGQLKGIWIAATNPVVSMPDLHQVRRALAQAELVVVQDCYHPTETTQLADIVLPAAAWGEKEGTTTNSERMVSYSEPLFPPPGQALPDWQIICRVARSIGLPGFDFASAEEVWDEWIGLTRGRLCDMAGMPYQRLRAERHLQWPCPDVSHPGTKRLYTDGRFPTGDGRANFLPRDHRVAQEMPDHEFPLVLTTGRLYAHWHTLTRTRHARKLVHRQPAPFVEVHPTVARRLGLAEGEVAQLSSRRGTVRLPVRITERVPPDVVFVPFHWGDRFNPGNAANYLTIAATGRVAKQPELKFCAASLEKIQNGTPPAGPNPEVQNLRLPTGLKEAFRTASSASFVEGSS